MSVYTNISNTFKKKKSHVIDRIKAKISIGQSRFQYITNIFIPMSNLGWSKSRNRRPIIKKKLSD